MILSESMNVNGRGFTYFSPRIIGAVVKFPEDPGEVMGSYMLAIHEMLHQVIDPVVYQVMEFDPGRRRLNPVDEEGFAIHVTLENMESVSLDLAAEYLAAISTLGGKDISSYDQLLEHYPLDPHLKEQFKKVVFAAL